MNDQNIEGTVRNATGKLQDAAGGLLGDPGLQLEGKARQVAGKAQALYGDQIDYVRDATQNNPIGALLIAAGIGFLIAKVL
jgi:uncharacterized protein YjbJ (UPF0337 family)